MPYSEFTIELAKARFGLTIRADETPFAFAALTPSAHLVVTLAESFPLALAISTEKARSELIVMPVLLEARRRASRPVSLFSGTDFPVDASLGLTGVCDFLLSQSRENLTVEAPVVTVVEAKRDDMKSGIGQCVAAMVGARLFNERKGRPAATIYGVVTTGSLWQFFALDDDMVRFDPAERHLSELDRVLGILVGMVSGVGARSEN